MNYLSVFQIYMKNKVLNLNAKCLNDSIDSRSSFNDIINELENNTDFITLNVNKDEYLKLHFI